MADKVYPGYVYLLINYSMPGLAKIGKTTRSPSERIQELSAVTGVPTPFHLVFDILVPDVDAAERVVHDSLAQQGYRTSENREFFGAPLHEIVKLMIRVRETFESTSRAFLPSNLEVGPDPGLTQPPEPETPLDDRDILFDEAVQLCIQFQQGSTSLLQRRLKISYGRAARLVDQLHHAGILGPPDGSKPRAILVGLDYLGGDGQVQERPQSKGLLRWFRWR